MRHYQSTISTPSLRCIPEYSVWEGMYVSVGVHMMDGIYSSLLPRRGLSPLLSLHRLSYWSSTSISLRIPWAHQTISHSSKIQQIHKYYYRIELNKKLRDIRSHWKRTLPSSSLYSSLLPFNVADNFLSHLILKFFQLDEYLHWNKFEISRERKTAREGFRKRKQRH